MKIALIQCPLWGTFDPPISLAQLSSCLKKEKHEVRVLDLNIKFYLERNNEYKNVWAWEQSDFWHKPHLVEEYCAKNNVYIDYYVEQILKEDVQLAGFSVNIASLYMSIDFAKRLKMRNCDIKIVFGGPLFINKSYINGILNDGIVDTVIIGEGEHSICRLAESIDKYNDISKVSGIAFKKNNSIIVTEPSPLVDLDSLPFLDFKDLALTDYDDPRHISLMTSRGCIRRCFFCSDASCWSGYRAMSGERIFQEVAYQKNMHTNIGHFDFLDLEFNGNTQSLIKFCELMIKNPLDIHWNANMIVRPEMTQDVIEKMARADCEHIIFGIESGSERVLKMMNKHYKIADADRIIRQMHEAGICVTTNFMFGFPGETEEDFAQTLDFLRRNAKFLDRCYPSRTYFALEEFSYVYNHPQEFGIIPSPYGHLFWESMDGNNTYPVRMERCRRFCELALELGIEVGTGVQTSVLQDEWFNLAHYYETRKDYPKAVENLLKYYEIDRYSSLVNNKILHYKTEFEKGAFLLNDDTSKNLTKVFLDIKSAPRPDAKQSSIVRLKPEISIAFIKTKIRNLRKFIESNEYNESTKNSFLILVTELVSIMDNSGYDAEGIMDEYIRTMMLLIKKISIFNDREFGEGRVVLASLPKTFFLQFAGPCNSSCVFCSRGHDYKYFNLSEFKNNIELKIAPYLALAQQFVLTGSGEFLRLKEWKEILDYFEKRYPYIGKMFSTNGSSLRPEVVELITSHKSHYAIHASLHASCSATHRIMTRMDNFELILNQIKYLVESRKKNNNIKIDLFFVATVLNIEDLPNFVHLAKELGVDSVVVNYNYIYVPAQKYLSCYFKPKLTNRIFNEAARLAADVGMNIYLPPAFNTNGYPKLGICRELWSQIMLDEDGHVLPCDASGDCNLRLTDAKYFYDIWNSEYYIRLRNELVQSRHTRCYGHCHRANPSSVNLFSSHVIHRGRQGQEIDEFWEDNF